MTISVVVATYGEIGWALTAARAVGSAQGQDAHEIIDRHEARGTVASSRNALAARADGDWLCFLDADDELAPGFIGAMERALERERDSGGNRVLLTPAVQTVRPGRTPGPPTFFKEVPLRQANWLVVGTLIHRDLFWEVGGFPEYPHGFEDWALWSKCVRVGATVVKVPDAVYRYWVNPNSMHRQGWRDKKQQAANHARIAAELDAWEAARV